MIYGSQKFCNTIRNRSEENKIAINLLYSNQLYSNAISILRQELDLMVRTIYVLGITDAEYRKELMKDFVEGRKWRKKDNRAYITDKEMVDYTNNLFGYAQLVYRFGCSFIHLSNLQNWLDEDVSANLDVETKKAIAMYINQYHGTGLDASFTFKDIIIFIPDIFNKIHDNLECYVESIEKERFGLASM